MKTKTRHPSCAIASLCLAIALTPLSLPAQNATEITPGSAPAAVPSTTTNDDDRSDAGWIGLIGLLGLGGLLRRPRSDATGLPETNLRSRATT